MSPDARPLYRDPGAGVDERVSDLLARMTLVEKVAQLGGAWLTRIVPDSRFDPDHAAAVLENGIGHVTRIGASTGLRPHGSARIANQIQRVLVERTRLGIPAVIHEEGVAGYCARDATVFPQALGLAATWDRDLVGEVAAVIRDQMLAVGARHNLAPVLDVARDPRWGRVEETYGESPELCARMGVAYVRSLQTDDLRHGVVATAKHFLAYAASIGGRNQAPVHLGPRELREVYAEPFAAAIREAGLASVMNSYSSIDGVPVAGDHHILTGLLRDELGFEGTVVADYWAVKQLHELHGTTADAADSAVQALTAGMDVELPALECYRSLPAAVEQGRLDEAVVDTACARVLAQKIQLGLFEDPYVDADRAPEVFDTPAQRELARRAATESVVLLENDGVLPLPADVGTIAVIGPHADDPRLLQGDYHYPTHLELLFRATGVPDAAATEAPHAGGSFEPGPHFVRHVTPLEGIGVAFGGASVSHVRGCPDDGDEDVDVAAAVEMAAAADVAIVCVGSRSGLVPDATVGEARDSATLGLPGAQTELVEAVAATGTPTVVVVVSGRVHCLDREREAGNALLWSILPGEEGGSALADVLSGRANPSGRLPVTLPRHVGQLPLHHDMRRRGTTSHWYLDYTDESRNPLYPFGHGLSYSTFEYGEVTANGGSTTEPVEITVEVTNTARVDGTEVVQLYATDVVASVVRPVRELIGFIRVDIAAGERRTVTFTVHPSRLGFHGADLSTVVTEPGEFLFHVGGTSDERGTQSASVHLTGGPASFLRREIVPTRAT